MDSNNIAVPSVTTVLSGTSQSKAGIDQWRQRVGDEEADRVIKQSTDIGTAVHEAIEKYLNNETWDEFSDHGDQLMAKRMTGAKVIENPSNNVEKWLLDTVQKQSKIVGIKMPEVAIFPSHQMNAFATGASKNKALVAVSQGLLDSMSQGEIEAVVGHEMSHVANGLSLIHI